ncbi:MAG: hypothetical protein HRF52_05360 [Ignavibacterium sp.]|jgi:hypothetical protein|uniref:hypothetical protein n=1 Tax=Ignavibacterium sp. TaxID=2651167 RepID=UPI003297BB39
MKDYLNLSAIILIIFLLMSVDCSQEISTSNQNKSKNESPSLEISILPAMEDLPVQADSVIITEYPVNEIHINNHYRSKAMYLRGIN